MSPAKLIILIILIIGIIIAIYLLISNTGSQPYFIRIIPLENIKDIDIDAQSEKILDDLGEFKVEEFTFESLVKVTGVKQTLKIPKPVTAVGNVKTHKQKVLAELKSFIRAHLSTTEISRDDNLRRMEMFMNTLTIKKPNVNGITVLIGAFNKCFDSTDVSAVISTLAKNKLKVKTTDSICWMIFDPNDYVKKAMIEIEKFTKIKFINKSIEISNPRNCSAVPDETLPVVDLVVLSNFNQKDARNTTDAILKDLRNKARIRVVSMSGITKEISVIDSLRLDSLVYNSLINSKKNTFLESRTLFIQALNHWEKISPDVYSKLYFLGPLLKPDKGEIKKLRLECAGKGGLLACPEQLAIFSKKKYPVFILNMWGIPSSFDIQKYTYDHFSKLGINTKRLITN